MRLWMILLVAVPVNGTGAYCSLWFIDLADAPYVVPFLQKHVDGLGMNRYVCLASHPSQYWFKAYGVYLDYGVDDISDVYVRSRAGKRRYVFIDYVTMLALMMTLLPLFQEHCLPWHEAILQSNNFPGEVGLRVTIRHYLHPRVWWLRGDVERSVAGGKALYSEFKKLKLPKFILQGYNFAAWRPYWQVTGPTYLAYSPPRTSTIKECFMSMLEEENEKARNEGRAMPSMKIMANLIKIYRRDYVEGPYLSKSACQKLVPRLSAM